MSGLAGLFDSTKRDLKRAAQVVEQISALEPKIKALTDDELRARTDEFRRRLEQGETLDDILPDALAVVREAAARRVGERHFDVQ